MTWGSLANDSSGRGVNQLIDERSSLIKRVWVDVEDLLHAGASDPLDAGQRSRRTELVGHQDLRHFPTLRCACGSLGRTGR